MLFMQDEIDKVIARLRATKKGDDITLKDREIAAILEKINRLESYQEELEKIKIVPVFDTESNIIGWSNTSHHNPRTRYVIVQRVEEMTVTAASLFDEMRKLQGITGVRIEIPTTTTDTLERLARQSDLNGTI